VLTAGTDAAAQAQRRAPPAIRVMVGGYMEQSFGYAHNQAGVRVSQARQTGFVPVVVARPNRLAQQSDSEVWFSGRARLPSGLLVGFVVQLEGNTQFGDQIDESYLFAQGAFGRVLLGSENDAAYLQHVSAPRAGATWGVLESPVTGWVYTPRFVSMLSTTAPTTTGDDQKLTWFTPRWSGMQVGASLTPNDTQDTREFSDRARDRTNAVSLSANGRWRWGESALAASAGWVQAAGVRNETLATDRRHRLDDWAVGVEGRYRDTAIGAGFRRLANKGGALDGHALAAGVAQEFGPGAVALAILTSRVAGTAAAPGRDRGDILVLSTSYRIAPGVALVGSGFFARYDNGRSRFGAEDRNRGAGVVSGLRLNF
jgi:outer membrane protein OmpU